MTQPLRPMRLGEILDRTFQIYRESFSRYISIAAAPVAVIAALHFGDFYWWHLGKKVPTLDRTDAFFWGLAQSLVYHHIAIIVFALFTPAVVHQTSTWLFGQPTSAKDSLRFSFSRWRSFLWIGVLLLCVVLLGSEIAAIGVLAAIGSSMDAMGLLNDSSSGYFVVLFATPVLGGILLFLWLAGGSAFMVPASTFENMDGFKALRRSWKLSRERRWHIALTWLMLFLLSWVLLASMQTFFWWGVTLLYRAWPASWRVVRPIYQPTLFGIQALLAVVMRPLYAIAGTLFYYDQRIRKEGFDIEWMMRSAGMTEPTPIAAPDPAQTTPEPAAPASVPVEEASA